MISGIKSQKLLTFCCASTEVASSGDFCCFPLGFWSVGVFREFCAVKVGDTASLRILVTFATLSSREQDDIWWIVDKSNG